MRLIARSFFTLLPVLCAQGQEAQSSFGPARTREAAALGKLPTPLEVAVADIVNYHRHRLPLPRGDEDVMLQLRFGNASASASGAAHCCVPSRRSHATRARCTTYAFS